MSLDKIPIAGEVTRDIVQVSQATDEMSSGSQQVRESVSRLSHLAEKLNDVLGRFKV